MTSDSEQRLRRFHARYPGITSRALARSGSYERLAARIPAGARVLDLGCGDGHLVELLARRGCHVVGLDRSAEELSVRRVTIAPHHLYVRGRAQQVPLRDASLDAVACHFAFMLFDEIERVVAELARVLVPGGRFVAILGGGPTAVDDGDAFHRFLAILARHPQGSRAFGDPRAKSEAGWRGLFGDWRAVTFEREELELSGSFDDVWRFLGSSYELDELDRDAIRDELRAQIIDDNVRCRAVIWVATAIR